MVVTQAALGLAAPDLQPKPHRTGQCHQRAIILVADAHERAADRAQVLLRLQHTFPLRPLPRRCPGHPHLLPVRQPFGINLADSRFCYPSFFTGSPSLAMPWLMKSKVRREAKAA